MTTPDISFDSTTKRLLSRSSRRCLASAGKSANDRAFINYTPTSPFNDGNNCCMSAFLWVLSASSRSDSAAIAASRAERQAATIPLFAELEPLLLAEFARLPEGTDLEAAPIISRYRDATVNLRTHFERIIKRAGVTPWPKLFHNLRASRETELMREHDLATVCKWIGNSPAVAAKHYAMCVDLNADFQRATGRAKSAAQNPAQSASITVGKGKEATKPTNRNRPVLPSDSDSSRCLLNNQVGDTGLEPVTSRV